MQRLSRLTDLQGFKPFDRALNVRSKYLRSHIERTSDVELGFAEPWLIY